MRCAGSSVGICQLDVVTGDGIWQVDSNGSRAGICQVHVETDSGVTQVDRLEAKDGNGQLEIAVMRTLTS